MLRAALFLKFDSVPQESFKFPVVRYNMVLSANQIADIIKLHRQNKSPDDIAAAVGFSPSSVYNWVAVKELKLSFYIGKPHYLLYIYIPILVT